MRLSDAALSDLRARNPVADVVARLGVELHRSGRTLMGPCPICGGGKSAQRFEVKTDESWVCAVCEDGGDVIRLVERAMGLEFRAAVEWLGGVMVLDPDTEARITRERAARQRGKEAEAARYREEERSRLWTMWTAATWIGGTLAADYLESRGLKADGVRLRFGEAVPYFHGETTDERGRKAPRRIHRGPAMLAPVIGLTAEGLKFAGLHITWLAPDGSDKATIADPDTGEILPSRKARGSVKGGFIDLIWRNTGYTKVVMGEGIETVLTAADLDGRPAETAYWSAISLGNMGGRATETVPHPTLKHRNGHAVKVPGPVPDLDEPGVYMPDHVRELTLLGDGDSERLLTEHALTRATARYARPGRIIRHAWAPDGLDFNDLVRPDGDDAP